MSPAALEIKLDYANRALEIKRVTYRRYVAAGSPEAVLDAYALEVLEAEEKVKLLELELKEGKAE